MKTTAIAIAIAGALALSGCTALTSKPDAQAQVALSAVQLAGVIGCDTLMTQSPDDVPNLRRAVAAAQELVLKQTADAATVAEQLKTLPGRSGLYLTQALLIAQQYANTYVDTEDRETALYQGIANFVNGCALALGQLPAEGA